MIINQCDYNLTLYIDYINYNLTQHYVFHKNIFHPIEDSIFPSRNKFFKYYKVIMVICISMSRKNRINYRQFDK